MNLPRRAAALALVAAVGAGCSLPTPTGGTTPTPASSTTPGPSATPSPGVRDLTRPGAAKVMVGDLMEAADALRAIMVTVTARDASVTVLRNGVAQTWAWRDGRVQQVPTDITYVDQRTFDPDTFDFNDVGALFRAAESVSGSRRGQTLQIVDYSGGLVSMSVSTNPESRPVFFHPDGTLLPTLDFTSEWGLAQGFADAVGTRRSASAVGFGSALGVYLDTPRTADGAFDRRQRTARTPVIVTPRSEPGSLRPFDPTLVRPDVVWGVLETRRTRGEFTLDTVWSCVVDDRADTGTPQMHFTVGDRTFVTDLLGTVR